MSGFTAAGLIYSSSMEIKIIVVTNNKNKYSQQLKKQQELLTEMVKEQKVENRNEREEIDNIEEFLERNVNFEKVLEQFVNQFQPKPEVKPEAE